MDIPTAAMPREGPSERFLICWKTAGPMRITAQTRVASALLQQASGEGDQQRLSQEDADNIPGREAQRLQHAHLADTLAHAHGHGVGRDQQDCKGDGGEDAEQERLHIPQETQEAQREGLLRFRLRLRGGVSEHVVDGLRDSGHGSALSARITKVPATASGRQALLQVLLMEVQLSLFTRSILDGPYGQIQVDREDVAL